MSISTLEIMNTSEYREGFQAFLNHKPFLVYMSREWKAGYLNAHYEYTHEDENHEDEEPDFSPTGAKVY